MMLGDESYAGATSFFKLKETIQRLTGFEYVIPTHQGRAAENVLFSYLVKEGDVVPGNSHFDTTKGHIEGRKAVALDCTVDDAKDTQLEVPFKGNVDPKKLEAALEKYGDKVPFIIVTITNKQRISATEQLETERQISSNLYHSLLQQADPYRTTIRKMRKSFIWRGQLVPWFRFRV